MATTTKYARRANGPWHIYPAVRHGVTTCGRRIGQYVATRVVTTLPEDASICPVCAKHDAAGTFRPVGGK